MSDVRPIGPTNALFPLTAVTQDQDGNPSSSTPADIRNPVFPNNQPTFTSTDAEIRKPTSHLDDSETIEQQVFLIEDPKKRDSNDMSSPVLYSLYIGHGLASWGDRMWEFALALLFMDAWPNSLFLVAMYGLISAGSVAVFGVAVGHLVDSLSRKRVVTAALLVQNSTVFLTACGVIFLSLLGNGSNGTFFGSVVFYSLVAGINILAGVGALADLAGNVAIERDWVVVVAKQSQEEGMLAKINAKMRQIDLFCKLIAPAVVGLLMSATSSTTAAIAITTWNASSAFLEYWLFMKVYEWLPALALRESEIMLPSEGQFRSVRSVDAANDILENGDEKLQKESKLRREQSRNEEFEGEGRALLEEAVALQVESSEEEKFEPKKGDIIKTCNEVSLPGKKIMLAIANRFQDFVRGWKIYLSQETVLAAISLALLYFTVLSFDALMTAELKWKGVPPVLLGVARGMAAVTGLAGTVAFPRFQAEIGTLRSGLWAVWLQWAFLVWCVLGVFFQGWSSSVLLMGGVVFSRVGLWMFDLAAIQLIQESVAERERGVVGGVQGSLQECFSMLSYAGGMLISDPLKFWILVVLSFGMVSIAALLYTFHVYVIRGHLFHFGGLSRPQGEGGTCRESQ